MEHRHRDNPERPGGEVRRPNGRKRIQSKKNAAIIVLAILVVALAILLYMTNADKNRLADTNAGYIPPADRVATFDMDSTIYGEGVEKVGLPGAEQEAEALPDAA